MGSNHISKTEENSFDGGASKYNKFNTYKNNDKSYINNNNNTEKKININNKNTNTNIKKNKFSKNNMPGVRLYNQHMEHIKKREQKIKKIKDEKEKLEKKELKFKPIINNNSKVPKNDNDNDNNSSKIEDKLISYGNKYKQNITNKIKENNIESEHRPKLTKETEVLGKIKRKIREENLPNHTIFINPNYLVEPMKRNKTIKKEENKLIFSFNNNNNKNLNNRSKSFDNIKKSYYKTYYKPLHPVTRTTTKILGRKIPLPQLTPDKNLYDYLYIEAKLLKEKRDIDIMKDMAKRFPFKPDLSKSMDKHKKQKKKKKNNVFDRLFKAQNLRNKYNKTPDNSKNKNNLKDSKTGQPLFKPIITRGPLNPNRRDLSYDKDLNNNNKLNNKNNEDLENKKKEENKKKYIEKINKMISEAKKLKYIELFNSLDSDNDGYISNKKIKISILDNKKLIALTPIFKELQYDSVRMDLNNFCQKVDNIEEFKKLIESEIKIIR